MQRYTAPGYTSDQRAMIDLLGNPPILRDSAIMLCYERGTSYEGLPSIAPPHIMRHACPVVEVLGRQRAIMPNGDLSSVEERA